jgi:uracil permease
MSKEVHLYGVDDLLPVSKMAVYGLQWALLFLPTVVILSSISSEYLHFLTPQRIAFLQKTLLITGFIMILQTLWGHRYPILDGPASALLLSFLVLAPHGIEAIKGGMMLGGAFLLLLSLSGILRRLEGLFTDNVIGVILILVPVSLLPYLGPMIFGAGPRGGASDGLTMGVSISVILCIASLSHWVRGFARTISLLLGIILGTIAMGITGRLSIQGVAEAQWFSIPEFFPQEGLRFTWSSTMTFLVAYMAVMINAVGSIYGISEVVGKSDTSVRVTRSMGLTGANGVFCGFLGIIGTVSYAMSPGVVLLTRVGSRYAVTLCGGLLLSLAFLQKALALLMCVPSSVVGAAMVAGLSAQVGAGVNILTRSNTPLKGRDQLVIGIPILLGGISSIAPGEFFTVLPLMFRPLLRNGLVVGIVMVFLLEHVILHKGTRH